MSQVRVNEIVDANGGSNVVLRGAAAPVGGMNFRNRIINGDMRIDQRNNGASVAITTAAQYMVDRWQVQNVTDGTLTAQQVVDAPAGFINSLRLTVGTADSSLSSGQLARVWQVVEANNVDDFALGTASAVSMSLSFWVKSSLTGTFGGNLSGGTSLTTSYVFTYTINAANTWEYKTISVPAATIGTWLTGNNAGIAFVFDLGAGSNFQKAAGSWGTGQYAQATASSSQLIGSAGATLNITGVQLEAGSVATPFERRPYGTELALCQRYFNNHVYTGAAVRLGTGGINNTTTARITFPIPVSMRATPTMTATNVDIRESADATRAISSFTVNGTWPGFITTSFVVSTSTAGSYAELRSNAAGAVSFSSEL